MALLEKQLKVKRSQLPNAGFGLYTARPIAKRTRIVEYKGRRSKWKDVRDEDGRNGYIFYINRNHVIDALPTKKALARYANDARGLVRVNGVINNAEYVVDGLKAYIESTRDIEAGAEIFVDYGKDYWKVIRDNVKLWKAEEKAERKTKSAGVKKKVRTKKKVEAKKKVKTRKDTRNKSGKKKASSATKRSRRPAKK